MLKLKDRIKDTYQIYQRQSSSIVETKYGTFRLIAYQSRVDYSYHLALVKGNLRGSKGVLMRVHSSCITGDIFGSYKCDCGGQLQSAMKQIEKEGRGILIYLFQEGRGINIINKLKTYNLQRLGYDTVEANEKLSFPAELREYPIVREILKDLGVISVRLLTNNPDKINKITDLGVIVEDVVPIEINPNIFNARYLQTKKNKMGHKLTIV